MFVHYILINVFGINNLLISKFIANNSLIIMLLFHSFLSHYLLNLFCIIFIYSFAAQNNEELSFVKGERLEILDRPPADPDWYRARNTLGSIGLIPKNYVQVN